MNLAAAANHWIHILSAVIWVGGLSFVVMILNPALRGKLPKESLQTLALAFREKFYRITGVLLVLILVTGGLNVHFVREGLPGGSGLSRLWLFFLGIKLTLATGLISLYLLNLLYRNEPWSEDQTEIPWARPSFILGVLIILMAAFLRHSHHL